MHILLHRGRHHIDGCVGDDRQLIKNYTLVPCRDIDPIDYDIDSSKGRSRGSSRRRYVYPRRSRGMENLMNIMKKMKI